MKFKNVNFNHKSEWIMWFLTEQDGYCSRKEIVDCLSSPLTYDIVAENTRKMKSVGLVHEDEMYVKNVNNKKIYKINQDEVNNYLDVKKEKGLGDSLSNPAAFANEEIDKLQEENNELRAYINRCDSDIKELDNKIKTLEKMFNNSQKRQSKNTRDIDTLEEEMETNRLYINAFIKWANEKFDARFNP